jgi:AhpD family alkylhydroperoxidase
MHERLDVLAAGPAAIKPRFALEQYLPTSSIEQPLADLVRLRASQINGCSYCVDVHVRDARSGGEDERRLSTVVAWRKAPWFSERERAALAWAEVVTQVRETHVPDESWVQVRSPFSEAEVLDLTLVIGSINL